MSHQKYESPLSRRSFLRLAMTLGSLSVVSSLTSTRKAVALSAKEGDQATLSPELEISEDGVTTIAFVKTTDRVNGINRALELLDVNPVENKSVFLKPNFNSADPAPGSTHLDVLRTLVMALSQMGASSITIGDRSGMGSTRAVMREIGVFDLADELGFSAVVFDELGADDWVFMRSPESHWKNGYYFSKPCLDADVVIQACCLKTHQYGGQFTMSLKNSVGMIAKRVPGNGYDYMTELHRSVFQREMIAEINSAYSPRLIVLDGIDAFVSGGPAKGRRVDSEVVLVGTDRIAIDAVGVALLRYHGNRTNVSKGPIFEQDQIARAADLGLGVQSPDKIRFLTDDDDSASYAEQIKEILLTG